MTELRQTETNAADDSTGRVFGLDGNLYLPVLLSLLGSLAGFAFLNLVCGLHYSLAGIMATLPLLIALAWILGLRQGKPAGYDRDFLEYLFSRGHFSRHGTDQEGYLQ
ncbi:MAG: hypothetical protein H7A44_08545 [Opitutaceae bacterium]|nr:hypothetical protein [Cephaloticoccus sp.]MCP5530479.1 hypothetical protein [Opitutaceae bacterium]